MKIIYCLTLSVLLVSSFATKLHAETAVIISAGSGLSEMTKTQIRDIYLGKKKKFPDGQPVVPVDQDIDDIRASFGEEVIGKDVSQLRSFWSRKIFTGKGQPPKQVGNDEAVLKLVRENPAILGYIDGASVDDSVKVVFRF